MPATLQSEVLTLATGTPQVPAMYALMWFLGRVIEGVVGRCVCVRGKGGVKTERRGVVI